MGYATEARNEMSDAPINIAYFAFNQSRKDIHNTGERKSIPSLILFYFILKKSK